MNESARQLQERRHRRATIVAMALSVGLHGAVLGLLGLRVPLFPNDTAGRATLAAADRPFAEAPLEVVNLRIASSAASPSARQGDQGEPVRSPVDLRSLPAVPVPRASAHPSLTLEPVAPRSEPAFRLTEMLASADAPAGGEVTLAGVEFQGASGAAAKAKRKKRGRNGRSGRRGSGRGIGLVLRGSGNDCTPAAAILNVIGGRTFGGRTLGRRF